MQIRLVIRNASTGADEDRDPQEVGHRVQRDVELGGDQVVAAADPEHARSRSSPRRRTPVRVGRVARPVEDVVLATCRR